MFRQREENVGKNQLKQGEFKNKVIIYKQEIKSETTIFEIKNTIYGLTAYWSYKKTELMKYNTGQQKISNLKQKNHRKYRTNCKKCGKLCNEPIFV